MSDPSAAAFASHAFEYDATIANEQLVTFLQKFYTLSDDREGGDAWAAHFAENGVMKKADTNVTGRAAIAEVNKKSWTGQASRQHIVHKTFFFSPGQTKYVMLHGSSKYVFEDGATGQLEWTARLIIDWTGSEPLIGTYHIFPTPIIRN